MSTTISRSLVIAVLAALVVALLAGPAFAKATKVDGAIYANDTLYGTVLTPTEFKSPPAHSLDTLYNFMGSGLTGQPSVSDAWPGSPDYNGGRWDVQLVTFTEIGESIHDPDGDGVIDILFTNADMVLEHAELGHITIQDANLYFECPLLRMR